MKKTVGKSNYKYKSYKNNKVKNNSLKRMVVASIIMFIISLSMISTKASAERRNEFLSGIYNKNKNVDGKIYAAGVKNLNSEKLTEKYQKKSKISEIVIDVPYIDQSSEYPTGCEVVSATMVLQYYGYDISVDEFIDDYLETSSIENREGVPWADHPDKAFIGNPRSSYSYGCYAPVIVRSMNKILGKGMNAKNITGTSLKKLEEYIDDDIPVIIWSTIEMKPTTEGNDWLLKGNGKRYHWIGGEHCLVLVGYDDEKYYFNDPYDNNGLVAYDKAVVEMRYEDMGKQAIVIRD